jgi:hypothetical protein
MRKYLDKLRRAFHGQPEVLIPFFSLVVSRKKFLTSLQEKLERNVARFFPLIIFYQQQSHIVMYRLRTAHGSLSEEHRNLIESFASRGFFIKDSRDFSIRLLFALASSITIH